MLPVRLVVDTNVVVSAVLKPDSLQRAALTIATTKPARLYVSQEVLKEYAEVLIRPKFGFTKGERLKMMQYILNGSHLVRPLRRIDICNDPKDNIVLECAEAARADYLLTGNRKHFPPYWRSTKIISATEFITIAELHLWG